MAYDHRGSGATVAPVESITFERLVDDVFEVLDAFHLEQCVLAAMSMGAAVALGAVLKNSNRFTGLVIVDGAYYWEITPGWRAFLTGLTNDYPRALDAFVNACVPEPQSDHIKRWGRQILERASQEAAIALYRMTSSIDLRNSLSQIHLPTLILHGDADAIVPVRDAQSLAKAIPQARLVTLAGAGHVPIMTRPAEVAHEISSFFGP